MNSSVNHSHNHSQTELRLVTKGIEFLAILTGLIYLRVVIGEGITQWQAGRLDPLAIITFLLLFAATVGLLATWQWDGVGGFISVLCGVGLSGLVYVMAETNKLGAALLYGSPFIIAGGLEILCWWQKRCPEQN